MLHKRVTPTERVYEKVVEPSLGSFQAIPHTSHCCVRYQPSLRSPKSPSLNRTYAATPPQQTTLPKIQLANRLTRSADELGRHGSVYQSNKADVSNLQRSVTPNSFNSTTRLKQVPLPQVQNHELVRSNTPRGKRNVSVSGDRYLGTSKSGEQSNSSSLHKTYPQYEAASLPKREQVRRFEDEQTNLYVTRTMKRKSEILSHRVDRMYYLCGSGFRVQGRYEVNDAELQRLRDFSRIRNNSRATSGHSSGRSGGSFTESSILAESRRKRSPLGSPLGSPRCTPVPGDETIDLSVEGNSVIQEVKGHAGSSQAKIENDRVGQITSGSKDMNVMDKDEKSEDCSSKTEDSSDKEKTSPHRTEEEENDNKNKKEQEGDSGHEDRQSEVPGRGGTTGQDGEPTEDRGQAGEPEGEPEGDRQTVNTQHIPANDDGAIDEIEKRSTTERDDGRGAEEDHVGGGSGDACKDEPSENTLQHVDGCHGDVDEAGREYRGGRDDGKRTEGNDGSGDASKDMSAGDTLQHEDGCHGDDSVDEGGVDVERVSQDGEEGLASEHQAMGDKLIESIAPGLNLDKTPFTMKKSDVYLTKFVDPKCEHLSETASDDDESRTDGNEHGSQIASMEGKLRKVSALTQEADDIGRMAGLDYDPLEFKADESDLHEGSYDGGVFARAKSDEDRRKAIQLREERKEAKSALKTEQQEAQRVREKAEKERAVKQANKLKFKMEDVYNFISSRQREIFSQKFRELDVDGNGKITLKELTKKMHKNVPKKDIHHLHKVFDLNKDKTIDEREFVTVAALNDKLIGQEVSSEVAPLELNLNRLSLHITAYKEMFEVVDQNGDGRLSMDEIMLIITASTGINIAIDKEAVRYIHNTIDKDGNGSIDFVEFLAFIPFFQKIYQEIIGKPVSIEEIEEARIAVKKAMNR